ncbi:MAG: isoleucine--tRNA ligase [Alphaproteobacteria bacterium]|nr:isoleucine--tRNA ligase [Alphaproteobacteria bacterium]
MADKELRQTLNLPETEFPMRAGLPKREPEWVKDWLAEDIYGKIRAARSESPSFILHLGPPYANGRFHMGHVLSYVLKDFIVRSKTMQNFNAPFVPGWDCHGLPIEWKVESELREKGKSKDDLSTKELRKLCRDYAGKWVSAQKEDWQRMGCLGDWDEPYLTMNPKNEAGMVRELGRLFNRGYVYKGVKSIMWSTVEETALAEAEIEYHDKESMAIFVAFPVKGTDENVVIWTTTPWTMPANRAVAYGEEVEYSLVEITQAHEKAAANIGAKYWFATELLESATKYCGIEEYAVLKTQKGSAFEGTVLQHPFYDREAPMIEGFHVTVDGGTGFVHIAPAHGAEDFQIGREVGLELECQVLGDGTYSNTVADLSQTDVALAGMDIWKAQKRIIEEMTAQGALLRWYKYSHSYPHSWRSKAPLIFRTTPQWFVAMDNDKNLRADALKEIDNVQWLPAYGRNRIYSMIEGRPDWCISRQRKWGVPITVFVHKHTGEVVNDAALFEHIAALVEAETIDAWDNRIEENRMEELFPAGWLASKGLSLDDLEPQRDILDVWFDSGTTHAHVMRAENERKGKESRFHREDGKRPADVYWEGSDQHRGWFHSSLLESVASYGEAPYETVLTHGFVVDGKGMKMSKSIGNGVEPEQLLKKYGMDIVRLWVAGSDYTEDIRYSDEIMAGISDGYRRFRNTFRYLLGNLSDFDAQTDTVPYADLPELEKWVLARMANVLTEVKEAYDSYTFHKAYRALYNFCATDLSNIYFDIRKDVLYCDAKSGHRRRSVQTVLMALLTEITTHLAPMMPFTTDEVWKERFGEAESVHLALWNDVNPEWQNEAVLEQFTPFWALREQVNLKVEALRSEGDVGSNLDVAVTLPSSAQDMNLPLTELLIVSAVSFSGDVVQAEKASGEKCPRCWSHHETMHATHTDVCQRCGEALDGLKAQGAAA